MCARKKGSGTLIKKGNYYLAKWVVDGKIYTRSTKCSSKQDAEKRLKEFVHPFQVEDDIEKIENLQAKIKVEENRLSDIEDDYASCSVEKMMDKYFTLTNAPSVTDSTRKQYDNYLSVFCKFLKEHKTGIKQVKEISKHHVDRFLSEKKTTWHPQRFNTFLSVFKRMWKEFSQVSRHRCFRDNPFDGFKYQQSVSSSRQTLSLEQLHKILSLTVNDEEMNLLMCIGIYTGLRKSDCCSLMWNDIDFENNIIHRLPIKTKKNKKQVVIPMHPVLKNKLLQQKAKLDELIKQDKAYDLDEKYVSRHLHDIYLTGGIDRKITAIFKKADIKMNEIVDGKRRLLAGFHSLRHTFISNIVNSSDSMSGMSMEILRSMVGHSSDSMTQKYEHVSIAAKSSAINCLPDVIDVEVTEVKKETVVLDSRIVQKIHQMTSMNIEEFLKDYISKNEDDSRNVLEYKSAM